MNIMIIGAGFTGIQLAHRLVNEGNKVVLIDNDADTVGHASNRLDCTVEEADGNNLENLEEMGIAKMDALITLTGSDEVNMITCSLVDSVYPKILKIARVRNYAYYVNTNAAAAHHAETFSGNHRPLYGIDFMVHPDVEAAEAIVSAVEHGAVSDVVSIGDSEEFELSAILVEKGSALDGIAIKDLRTKVDFNVVVAFIETEKECSLPSGNTVIQHGNRVGFLTSRENLKKLLELCGTKIDALKKIALVGAGRIGTIVAEHIIEKGKSSLIKRLFGASKKIAQEFVIIDSDRELCKAASEKFPSAKVFCGDATDESFVREEGLDEFNLVISATHNHAMNMVICAYFETLGVEKTVTLTSSSMFTDITRKLGIEVAVPLRDTVVDSIMSHLRGKAVTGVHTICNGEFEIVECDLPEESTFNGKTLKEISSPGEYLLLLIKKAGSDQYDLPGGNTELNTGDHIVLIEKTGDKKILGKFSAVNV